MGMTHEDWLLEVLFVLRRKLRPLGYAFPVQLTVLRMLCSAAGRDTVRVED
jgi:hypothetical protein